MISLSHVTIRPSPRQLELYAIAIFAGIQSYREPLEEALDEVVRPRIVANFRSETAAFEEKWTRLAPATARARERMGYGAQTPKLQRTNRLFRTAYQKNIWKFRTQQVHLDVDALTRRVPYAMYHQEGALHLPAREYLVINEMDAEKIEQIFGNYLMKREIAAALSISWARSGLR